MGHHQEKEKEFFNKLPQKHMLRTKRSNAYRKRSFIKIVISLKNF